jgi:hypothetical protein
MQRTTIIGVDCATSDTKVGLAIGDVEADRCVIRFAGACPRERRMAEQVSAWVTESAKVLIAFDAPLGWPQTMGDALGAHRAGQPLEIEAHQLFRRETDRFVRVKLGKQSLDVGADRIARTAHSALKLLAEVRVSSGLPIPLAWTSDFSARAAAIEVYPAATLRAHGVRDVGYKHRGKITERREILNDLESVMVLPADRRTIESYADPLDAAICVLAGFDFLKNAAYSPKDAALAEREGWIWVRRRVSNDTSPCT